MGSDGCAGAKDLLADNPGLNRPWQRGEKPDDPQREFLRSHAKIDFVFVRLHSSVRCPLSFPAADYSTSNGAPAHPLTDRMPLTTHEEGL
jgi:hypothetical protein